MTINTKSARLRGKSIAFMAMALMFGCASYTTPGGSVKISELADADINELMSRQPQAEFPAHVVIARIQAPEYRSQGAEGHGTGRYSVVTTREVEGEEDIDRMSNWPKIAQLVPLNRLLLPPRLNSIKDLRSAAARARADILLVYSLDTAFRVGPEKYPPLTAISLGFSPNQEANVTTTSSAVFFDVRTEFVYGFAEATARETENAGAWSSDAIVDRLRKKTERDAFQGLVGELEKTWDSILQRFTTVITPVPDRPAVVPGEKL
jgi:hypothetical protein